MPIVIYIHGFASGPLTEKAIFFKKKLKKHNIALIAPDLNTPSFRKLSLHAMVTKISNVVKEHVDQEIFIVTSSLGTIPFLQYMRSDCSEKNSIRKAVFLAPSFNFLDSLLFINTLAPKITEWEGKGKLSFFHYYYKRFVDLGYSFLEEARNFDVFNVTMDIPTLLIHGTDDEVVDYNKSIAFAEKNSKFVRLALIKADHIFESSKDELWNLVKPFLNLIDSIEIKTLHLSDNLDFEFYLNSEDFILRILAKAYEGEYLGDEFQKARIRNEKGIIYLAIDKLSDSIVGLHYVQNDGKQTALAVVPSFQSKGIGELLIQHSFADFDYLYGEVRNSKLKSLMISLGFSPITSMTEVLEKLKRKEKSIIEIRQTNDSVIYIRTNPNNKSIFYQGEILHKQVR